ncbi:MAG: hypothetical protein R2941_21300 [Desulfobacterales bacterium]
MTCNAKKHFLPFYRQIVICIDIFPSLLSACANLSARVCMKDNDNYSVAHLPQLMG